MNEQTRAELEQNIHAINAELAQIRQRLEQADAGDGQPLTPQEWAALGLLALCALAVYVWGVTGW